MLERHGWRLAGHPLLIDQLDRLIAAAPGDLLDAVGFTHAIGDRHPGTLDSGM